MLRNFLNFECMEREDKFIISEEQKTLVDIELEKIKDDPSYLLNWDEVKCMLKTN